MAGMSEKVEQWEGERLPEEVWSEGGVGACQAGEGVCQPVWLSWVGPNECLHTGRSRHQSLSLSRASVGWGWKPDRQAVSGISTQWAEEGEQSRGLGKPLPGQKTQGRGLICRLPRSVVFHVLGPRAGHG